MQVIKSKDIYVCEWCRKKYLAEHNCRYHEEFMCYMNPNNQHKCTSCSHLAKMEKQDKYIDSYDHVQTFNFTTYFCRHLNTEMYTYKLSDRKRLRP